MGGVLLFESSLFGDTIHAFQQCVLSDDAVPFLPVKKSDDATLMSHVVLPFT